MFDSESCEKAIGYTFKNKKLLMQCFTHSSYSNEHKNYKNNERLEFLGDSILGYIVTVFLYNTFPDYDEGLLTQEKQAYVSKEPLSKASMTYGFNEFLIVGEGIKNQQNNKNLCENLFESIVAGIFIDGGIENTEKFVMKFLFNKQIKNNNYKGILQEYVQKNHLGELNYVNCDVKGPQHNLTFSCEVYLNDVKLGRGEASSKQKAQQVSAEHAYKFLLSQK